MLAWIYPYMSFFSSLFSSRYECRIVTISAVTAVYDVEEVLLRDLVPPKKCSADIVEMPPAAPLPKQQKSPPPDESDEIFRPAITSEGIKSPKENRRCVLFALVTLDCQKVNYL